MKMGKSRGGVITKRLSQLEPIILFPSLSYISLTQLGAKMGIQYLHIQHSQSETLFIDNMGSLENWYQESVNYIKCRIWQCEVYIKCGLFQVHAWFWKSFTGLRNVLKEQFSVDLQICVFHHIQNHFWSDQSTLLDVLHINRAAQNAPPLDFDLHLKSFLDPWSDQSTLLSYSAY